MLTDEELAAIEERYTPEEGVQPGVVCGRHQNEARTALGDIYRHRLGKDGDYPEIGVVEVTRAQSALASAYAVRDECKSALADVLVLVKELKRLRAAGK